MFIGMREKFEMDKIIDFLRKNNVKTVLDIGANVGHYSLALKAAIPDLYVLMLEGNLFCAPILEKTGLSYDIACLSNVEKKVKLYLNPRNMVCTGTSYYKENTEHYTEETFITVNTRTLDRVILSKFGDQRSFEFIKMDTQGSELDIIEGGEKTFAKAKYIQMEVSLMEYNAGAPLKDHVFEYMENIGFKPEVMVEEHYWNQDPKNEVIQEDWIFLRNV